MRPVVCLLALSVSSAAAAQGWHWVSPKPQGVAVNSVAFAGTEGWLVGAGGTIAMTPDGALTFSPQNSGVSVDLYGVFFLSTTVGWAVGDQGTILATQNGGSTWIPQTSGTTRLLRGVYFTDSLHGVAVGDFRTLLQTADGGKTWTGRGTSALALNAVTFTDAQHGFICGDSGVVMVTTDGGNTFNPVQTPSSAHLLAIAFGDALHGFAVGEGGALVTTSDGGQSWTAQTVGTSDLVAVVAVSATQAYALGSDGSLYGTTDGAHWALVKTLMASGLFTALIFEPDGTAFDATAQSGQWLRSAAADGGPLAFADANDLFPRTSTVSAAAFTSLDAGVLIADKYLYVTKDRGAHVAQVGPASIDGGQMFGWLGISAASATDVFAVGIRGTAAVSRDRGETWTQLDSGVSVDLEQVSFLPDSGVGYAVGANGVILLTNNSGASWSSVLNGDNGGLPLTNIAFYDSKHGVLGGENGEVLWSISGMSFEASRTQFGGTVTGLAYPALGVILAATATGGLAHSTNEGLNFYNLATPVQSTGFGAMAFASRQNGWLGGSAPNGSIWGTSDGAQTFGQQFAGTAGIDGFSFVDAVHGYAVGLGGTLLVTDTAGGPSCAKNADCADAGYAGISCVAGACLPCTTDDRCGAACTACAGSTPYCYGAYCGVCENDQQCSPGYCVLGQCQQSPPPDGGSSNGSSAGSSGTAASSGGSATGGSGGSTGTSGNSSGATTGTCAGSPACQTSSCGCSSSRPEQGAEIWGVLLAVAIASGVRSRRRRG